MVEQIWELRVGQVERLVEIRVALDALVAVVMVLTEELGSSAMSGARRREVHGRIDLWFAARPDPK